jgi:hypothetical protein
MVEGMIPFKSRRAWRLAVVAVITVSLTAGVQSATATSVVYGCQSAGVTGNNSDTFQTHIDRIAGDYQGVLMNVYVRDLPLCLNPTTNIEASSVLLAFQTGGTLHHLGYAKCGPKPPTVSCSFDPNGDGKLHFVVAINNGLLLRLDGTLGITPVVGHQYRFRMDLNSCGCLTVRVLDRTAGETSYHAHDYPTAQTQAGQVWWGTEIHFSTSAMGTGAGSPDLYMEDIEYRLSGASTWTRVDNQTTAPFENYSAPNGPSYPSWYHSYMENGPYPPLDRMQSHTHAH